MGPAATKALKSTLHKIGVSASKVAMATSPLVLSMTATLKECKKPGLKEKLAPYSIKEPEQGLADAKNAKAACEAMILNVASPPTDVHLNEKHITEQCKTWQATADHAKVMIGMAKCHNA